MQKRIDSLNLDSTHDAKELLDRIHREFPLPGSGMPDSFKGTHSITLEKGKLCCNIWVDNQCWPVTLDT